MCTHDEERLRKAADQLAGLKAVNIDTAKKELNLSLGRIQRLTNMLRQRQEAATEAKAAVQELRLVDLKEVLRRARDGYDEQVAECCNALQSPVLGFLGNRAAKTVLATD